MTRCPVCSHHSPDDNRFCPACGAGLDPASSTPTRAAPPESDSYSSAQGRFLPGTVLAERYRVIGLVGKGGMGEVYRADDLKLGQPVALKFLPLAVEKDQTRLSRFLNEVKIARQISHPNVCRVYDLGEAEGHHFLTMEYVDGEDLASLLRRIGRLPKDKAVQIARQLCAGVAAAHEQGILHRDLKPANVMIDGRGRTRITDFGLAGLAADLSGAEARAGTPAYMSPEQIEGKGVSVKSDLYALGLVLYELFTGQPTFKASTLADLSHLQTQTTPLSPSTFVEGFDPEVERVILRCLQREPKDRPSSALMVAASLPGGDPLAAALAAGETPSPELVAEAGQTGGLKPAAAWACLAALAIGLFLVILLSDRTQLTRIVPLPKAPEVLTERARDVIRKLSHAGPPRDAAFGFDYDKGYLRHLVEHDPTSTRWDHLRTGPRYAVLYWYRESPQPLVPFDGIATSTRVGLLATVLSLFINGMLHDYPMTFDLSAWYARNTVPALLVIVGLSAYGLRVSLTGRRIFRDAMLEG